jgi:predicted  nucleic acid-binding Zn-ribbon protein
LSKTDEERRLSLDFGLIRSLHRLLKQQTDLREQLENGPRKVQLVKLNESKFLKALEDAKAELKRIHQTVEEKQLQLDEREARVAQLKFHMNTCDSNKEFQLIKERIAADVQANSVLQDEILELLERLDLQKANCEVARINFEKARVEKEAALQSIKSDHQYLQAELNRVTQELAAAEKKLPGELLKEYRHAIKGLGENVFGETDGQNCGNCFQSLTIQKSADLRMNRAVYCQGCGSLLYPAEKTSLTTDN